MKFLRNTLIASSTLFSLTTATLTGLQPDAVTAATKTGGGTLTTNVVQGPDVTYGASVSVGQTLQIEVSVFNPWTNNDVSMSLANKLPSMSLTQSSTNKTQPTWLFTWTPDANEVGVNKVGFAASFKQTSGPNSGQIIDYTPYVIIKTVAENKNNAPDTTAIKSLSITRATWNTKTNSLYVSGRVKVKSGSKLPSSTNVILSYQSGQQIPDAGASVDVTKRNGNWSTIIYLPEGQNPCSIVGLTTLSGEDTQARAAKKVTGKAFGCKP